jgi:hypothetical protein
MTDNDLEEWLETAIDDSFDLGWTSGDAARLIVSRMRAEGLVVVKAEPVVWLYERNGNKFTGVPHLRTWSDADREYYKARGWTETPLYATITGDAA